MRGWVGFPLVVLVAACSWVSQPAWVRDRAPLPSCGEVTIVGDEQVPEHAAQCMLAAFHAGAGAELIVRHRQPADGLPVDGYSRLHPDGTAELILHIDPERSGIEGWELNRCEVVEPSDLRPGSLQFSDCQMVELP